MVKKLETIQYETWNDILIFWKKDFVCKSDDSFFIVLT